MSGELLRELRNGEPNAMAFTVVSLLLISGISSIVSAFDADSTIEFFVGLSLSVPLDNKGLIHAI